MYFLYVLPPWVVRRVCVSFYRCPPCLKGGKSSKLESLSRRFGCCVGGVNRVGEARGVCVSRRRA